jgi:hypothetical protein
MSASIEKVPAFRDLLTPKSHQSAGAMIATRRALVPTHVAWVSS